MIGRVRLCLGGELLAISGERPSDEGRADHAPFLLDPRGPSGIELALADEAETGTRSGLEALHRVDGSWALYAGERGYRLEIAYPDRDDVRTIVDLDPSFTKARVATRAEDGSRTPQWSLAELLNPTLQWILMNRLARSGDALMIHAVGIRHGGEGLLFVGPSGSGKSTLAKYFEAQGGTVLCDECVVVRRRPEGWELHGTPFHGEVTSVAPGPVPLGQIYLIRHDSAHRVDLVGRSDVSRHVIPQLFLPFWNAAGVSGALAACERLMNEVPCSRLGFAKSPDIVSFLASRQPRSHALEA